MRTKKEKAAQDKVLTREQELEARIAMLEKALQYSELRNEALNEVIKVYNESEGVDILKKLVPSSVKPARQASPHQRGCSCRVV